jgi:hypothetical protein
MIFIQEGGLRYSATLGFSAVLHKEIDVAATSRSSTSDWIA